jgi:hypothetical protein
LFKLDMGVAIGPPISATQEEELPPLEPRSIDFVHKGGGAGPAVSAHALIGTMHRMNVQNVDRPEHFVRIFLYPVLMAPAFSRRVTAQVSSGPAVQQAKHRLNPRKGSAMNNDRRKANGGWPSL